MKEKIEKWFNIQLQIKDMQAEHYALQQEIISMGVSARALKFQNELRIAEKAILQKHGHLCSIYDYRTLGHFDNINLVGLQEETFVIELTYTDSDNDSFSQTIILPFDESKDSEYIEKAKKAIVEYWEHILTRNQKKHLEHKKNLVATLQREIKEIEESEAKVEE